ncbi:MAG: hypothetical protein ACK45Z_09545, partial [Dolichospermum sp.]
AQSSSVTKFSAASELGKSVLDVSNIYAFVVVAENNRKIKNYGGNSLTFSIKQLILVFVNTGIY